jgi:hypothetical protein
MTRHPPPFDNLLSQAKEAIVVLQLQGYIGPTVHAGKWRISQQGQLVSGAKSPRFSRKSIEDALGGLHDRIKAVNSYPDAVYKIIEAVAFGDFLGCSTCSGSECGNSTGGESADPAMPSVKEHAAALDFLKQLRGKTALLHIVPYEDWMSSRSRVRLL